MCHLRTSEELALVRQLQARGIVMDEEQIRCMERNAGGLRIDQIGCGLESFAEQHALGGVAYAILLSITNSTLKPLAPVRVQIEVPGDDWGVTLLEDCYKAKPRKEFYSFSGHDLSGYARQEVLNHQLTRNQSIPPRHGVEGMLLAIGGHPIPDGFANDTTMPAFVTVSDQHGDAHRQRVQLIIHRRRRNKKTEQHRPRLNLAAIRAREAQATPTSPSGTETLVEQPAPLVECSK